MQLMLAQPRIDVESPVVPTVSFDPPVVQPGEPSTLRITINALETAVDWDRKLPAPPSLTWRPGAHGQILSMTGQLLVPRTTFNFRVRSSAPGQFAVPEFPIKVNGKDVKVPAAKLEVTTNPPAGTTAPQQLLFDIPTDSLYVGQTVRARVLLPGSANGQVQSLGQVQINGQGFIVDQSSVHARIEAIATGLRRRPVNTFVYEMMLTPIATGKIVVFAQAYAVGNRVIGGVIMPNPGTVPGTLPQYTLLDTDPVTLEVRPLPPRNDVQGFTGAVGSFSIDPPMLSTNIVAAGEPLVMRIRVRGEGNLSRLVPPPPPRVKDWQVFPATADNTLPQIIQAQGSITFDYTLIPLTDSARNTPALPFAVFNPDHIAYDDLTIPPMAVTVLPGKVTTADLQTLIKAQALDREVEKEPVLRGLAIAPGLRGGMIPVQNRAWFPLLHLVPAGALLGLWLWDRRRRFMEQNPGIVLRRRALRALRRERRLIRRAAAESDSATFAAAAVNAMKLAVAPYYPAEPRALVGVDVVTILPETERSGRAGQTVRRFFAESDAASFAAKPTDTHLLLAMRPELEGVLDELEARLCE
jgi:hypothetical protein